MGNGVHVPQFGNPLYGINTKTQWENNWSQKSPANKLAEPEATRRLYITHDPIRACDVSYATMNKQKSLCVSFFNLLGITLSKISKKKISPRRISFLIILAPGNLFKNFPPSHQFFKNTRTAKSFLEAFSPKLNVLVFKHTSPKPRLPFSAKNFL